jgi:LysM repeat protein
MSGRAVGRSLVSAGVCAAFLAACSGGRHPAKVSAPSAPVTTVPITTTTVPPVTYTVKSGDTLGSIAKKFGVPAAAIAAANHITDPDKIAAGQVLIIPPPPVPPSTVPSLTPTTASTSTVAGVPKLAVSPAHGQVGAVFNLNLTGAKPGESITFEIDSPDGRKFTGPAHTATAQGTVTATYLTTEQDPPGAYSVVAIGSQGTSARGSFQIDSTTAASTTTTHP